MPTNEIFMAHYYPLETEFEAAQNNAKYSIDHVRRIFYFTFQVTSKCIAIIIILIIE